MRYVFILMMLMSFSAHAEEWEKYDNEYDNDIYIGDVEFNVPAERVLFKVLSDNFNDSGTSTVWHIQIECADRKPVRQRDFYSAHYQGRMATGNVEYSSEGAPWIPFEMFGLELPLEDWCGLIERKSLY